MSRTLYYRLEVTVADDASDEDVKQALQEQLVQLYETEGIEAVKVIDRTPTDEDIEELIEVIDSIESKAIIKSIEFARRMQELDDE